MKQIISLSLLIVLGGCAVTSSMSGVQVSHQFSEAFDGVLVESYDDLETHSSKVRAEAMTITDGRTYHRSQSVGLAQYNNRWSTEQDAVNWHTKSRCEQLYKVKCVISREGSKVIYANYDDYKHKESKRIASVKSQKSKIPQYNAQNLSQEEYIARQRQIAFEEQKKKEQDKLDAEEKRVAVLVALKERCIEYGFTGNNNIASCIQREAQHDFEIEQQKYQVQLLKQELANQRLYASQNTQQVEVNTSEEVPWWLEILGAVAVGASEGYKQQQIINTLDNRYQKKSIYRYQPPCGPGTVYSC